MASTSPSWDEICTEPCQHWDCHGKLLLINSKCRYCGKRIGAEAQYIIDIVKHKNGFTMVPMHTDCSREEKCSCNDSFSDHKYSNLSMHRQCQVCDCDEYRPNRRQR